LGCGLGVWVGGLGVLVVCFGGWVGGLGVWVGDLRVWVGEGVWGVWGVEGYLGAQNVRRVEFVPGRVFAFSMGSCLRIIDFVYHSTLFLRVQKDEKKRSSAFLHASCLMGERERG
jgi:hypothetical protein